MSAQTNCDDFDPVAFINVYMQSLIVEPVAFYENLDPIISTDPMLSSANDVNYLVAQNQRTMYNSETSTGAQNNLMANSLTPEVQCMPPFDNSVSANNSIIEDTADNIVQNSLHSIQNSDSDNFRNELEFPSLTRNEIDMLASTLQQEAAANSLNLRSKAELYSTFHQDHHIVHGPTSNPDMNRELLASQDHHIVHGPTSNPDMNCDFMPSTSAQENEILHPVAQAVCHIEKVKNTPTITFIQQPPAALPLAKNSSEASKSEYRFKLALKLEFSDIALSNNQRHLKAYAHLMKGNGVEMTLAPWALQQRTTIGNKEYEFKYLTEIPLQKEHNSFLLNLHDVFIGVLIDEKDLAFAKLLENFEKFISPNTNLDSAELMQRAKEHTSYSKRLPCKKLCIKFDFYEEVNHELFHVASIYSNAFRPKPMITKIKPPRGPSSGQTKVKLYFNTVLNLSEELVVVKIWSQSSNWISAGTIDTYSSNSIECITPMCPEHVVNSKCWVQLKFEHDDISSNKVSFLYEDASESKKPRSNKRKIEDTDEQLSKAPSFFKDSLDSSSRLSGVGSQGNLEKINDKIVAQCFHDSESIKPQYVVQDRNPLHVLQQIIYKSGRKNDNSSNELEEFLETYEDQYETGNSILHDAIADGQLEKLYIMAESQQGRTLCLSERLSNTRNCRNQTPLHYACELKRANYIPPLIRMNTIIYAQDGEKNTPLHFAIQSKLKNCIKQFEKLFENPSRYAGLSEQLTMLLQRYNKQGFTVQHLAVLYNQKDLVKKMLLFCQKESFNVLDYDVLGNGDSILHLALKARLKEMSALIVECLPEARDHKNYEGESALDLSGNSEIDDLTQKLQTLSGPSTVVD